MASITDIRNPAVIKTAMSKALPWRFKWRDLEHAMVRDFFFLQPELSDEQNRSLRRLQLNYLGWGASYWMAALIIFAGALAAVAEKESTLKFLIWCVALCIAMLPYFLLMPQLLRLPQSASEEEIQRVHFLWCAWLTIVAMVWFSAYWTLREQPQPDGAFHLARQIFVYFTILALVFVVMFLSPSRAAIFYVITIGVLLPFAYVDSEIIANQVKNGARNPQVNIYIYFYGQIGVWYIIGMLAAVSHKRLVAKAILAESEHQRANNFVVTISHDVKQPLTALALKLGTLRRKLDSDSPLLADVHQLQQQTTALETMIRASFDLSRLHAGTWKVNIREVALPNLVEKIVGEMRLMAKDKGLALDMGFIPPCLIWTDPDALERILRNLIGNAIKYTPASVKDEPGRIVVKCEKRGEFIAIVVADNGIGIPQAKINDIFKEYVQVDNPERNREKGFGLGLSIVDHLAKLLQHRIEVESDEGHGSRFAVIVRRAASIPPELRRGRFTEPTGSSELPNLKDLVVVLVEDDASSREALYELLIEWGCYVIEAESASGAIDKLRAEELTSLPNFILSDYRLREGKNGLEAITAIRNELRSSIPAAIWSAETSPQVLQRIASAGVEMLSKPVDEMRLLNLLKGHCLADVTLSPEKAS